MPAFGCVRRFHIGGATNFHSMVCIYLGDPICKDGWPWGFVGSQLTCKRVALSGFISKSCCMSSGRTLNTACRSFFNFWQVSAKSTPALPDFSIISHYEISKLFLSYNQHKNRDQCFSFILIEKNMENIATFHSFIRMCITLINMWSEFSTGATLQTNICSSEK